MKQSIKNWIKAQGSAVFGFAILFIFLSIASPNFLNPGNLLNVGRQMSISMITAVGMTLIIITGGINLSIAGVFALSGTLLAVLVLNYGMPIFVAIILVLIFCYLLGCVIGWSIVTQDLPPFIVTLAMLTIITGMAFLLTGGRPVAINTDAYRWLGRGFIFKIPVPIIVMISVVIFGHILLTRTSFGRYIYAYGGNTEAARLCGINVRKLIIHVYAIGTALAGLSGIILSSRLSSGSPTVGVGAELDAIAAVVLGGTSLSGGKGSIIGTIFGALIIAFLSNGMNLLNIDSYNQMIVKGFVILLSVWVNNINFQGGKKWQSLFQKKTRS